MLAGAYRRDGACTGGLGSRDPVYSHRAAEPWPIPFTFGPTSLCNVSEPRRVEQSGEKHGDSENI